MVLCIHTRREQSSLFWHLKCELGEEQNFVSSDKIFPKYAHVLAINFKKSNLGCPYWCISLCPCGSELQPARKSSQHLGVVKHCAAPSEHPYGLSEGITTLVELPELTLQIRKPLFTPGHGQVLCEDPQSSVFQQHWVWGCWGRGGSLAVQGSVASAMSEETLEHVAVLFAQQ